MSANNPVLYLLPGLLCDETVWSHQSSVLANEADVRIPNYRLCESIEEMAQFVLSSAPETFAVAGHSMGARVAMEIVRMAPDRVFGLALLDTGTHSLREGETEKRRALLELAYSQGMRALAERWLPGMVDARRVQDANLMGPLTSMVERMTPEIFERQVHALLKRPDAAKNLHLITCPLLLGVGRQDVWSPISQHEEIAALVSHADLVIFEDSGHMSPVEVPDAVTQALASWLRALPKRSPALEAVTL